VARDEVIGKRLICRADLENAQECSIYERSTLYNQVVVWDRVCQTPKHPLPQRLRLPILNPPRTPQSPSSCIFIVTTLEKSLALESFYFHSILIQSPNIRLHPSRTLRSYSGLCSLHIFAASTFAGLSSFGSASMLITEIKIFSTLWIGDHRSEACS